MCITMLIRQVKMEQLRSSSFRRGHLGDLSWPVGANRHGPLV